MEITISSISNSLNSLHWLKSTNQNTRNSWLVDSLPLSFSISADWKIIRIWASRNSKLRFRPGRIQWANLYSGTRFKRVIGLHSLHKVGRMIGRNVLPKPPQISRHLHPHPHLLLLPTATGPPLTQSRYPIQLQSLQNEARPLDLIIVIDMVDEVTIRRIVPSHLRWPKWMFTILLLLRQIYHLSRKFLNWKTTKPKERLLFRNPYWETTTYTIYQSDGYQDRSWRNPLQDTCLYVIQRSLSEVEHLGGYKYTMLSHHQQRNCQQDAEGPASSVRQVDNQGYHLRSPAEGPQKGIPVTDVIQVHITIQGVKFLNEPFIEVPTSTNIIIGNLWLADHIAAPDCCTRQLHWLDRKPESASLIKNIAINLKNQPKVDPGHQYDADRKDALMDQADIRTKGGRQIVQVAIDELYLDTSSRIQRSYNYNIFNVDQKASYRKMNDALVQLNSLVFDIPEPPSYPLTPEDLSPPILPTR